MRAVGEKHVEKDAVSAAFLNPFAPALSAEPDGTFVGRVVLENLALVDALPCSRRKGNQGHETDVQRLHLSKMLMPRGECMSISENRQV